MTAIHWMGQSCFVITADDGTKIVIDPFAHDDPVNYPGLEINYPPVDVEADIVVVSHMTHFDHDNIAAVKGDPIVVNKPGVTNAKGIEFRGLATFHRGESGFSDTPFNHVYCWTLDGLRFCHVGDLGYVLDEGVRWHIGRPDLLFMPVGEGFTAPHADMLTNIDLIDPRVVVPMHYRTDEVAFLPKTVDDFIEAAGLPTMHPDDPFVVSPDTLPNVRTICVLKKP